MARVALICDFLDEQWASMNLVADMLEMHLHALGPERVQACRIRPDMKRWARRLPSAADSRLAWNVDRLLGRWLLYPTHLRRRAARGFDFYHVADHSYAHLVHVLPPDRTGVYCHDVELFRCLFDAQKPRNKLFQRMAQGVLQGMQKAAVVFYSTSTVRELIVEHDLVDAHRLVHAPYGTCVEFSPEPVSPDPAAELLQPLRGAEFLLHVGSCVPRKRVDVLLDVFAEVRRSRPDLRLIQVGGRWTPEHLDQIRRLNLGDWVFQVRGVSREALASLYRQARLVLIPSELEGFGLPTIEALACGAAVIASDIPALREVGQSAVRYCRVADVPEWTETIVSSLNDSATLPSRGRRLERAARFNWSVHAETILRAYERLGWGRA